MRWSKLLILLGETLLCGGRRRPLCTLETTQYSSKVFICRSRALPWEGFRVRHGKEMGVRSKSTPGEVAPPPRFGSP